MRAKRNVRGLHLAVLGLAGALATGGLFGLARPAGAASCPQNGQSVVCTFSNAAAPETWVVPAGVTSAQISVQGGSGGDGAKRNPPSPGSDGSGGPGGITTSTVSLVPGTSLGIYVGGNGGDGQGCDSGDTGLGGRSGGTDTGGEGGEGATDEGDVPQACAGGGGGGGSFVMTGGKTPSDIEIDEGGDPTPGSAIPLLAAGGGGGGGGGTLDDVENDGGEGGGKTSGQARDGFGETGGVSDNTYSASGDDGAAGTESEGDIFDGGGGGGGGFPGGNGGGTAAAGVGNVQPGSGGGGGEGFPEADPDPAVVPASVSASSPTHVVGPVSHSLAMAGSPGSITITYTAPPVDAPNTTATANCSPANDRCVASPPAGEETEFKVVASGGNEGAQLFAILNGGLPPTCKSVGGQLSPDWVQFGFKDPKDGRSWSKKIRVTGTNPASKDAAKKELAQTQICFAAPYKFVVKRGFKLSKPAGSDSWEGLLAHCKSRIVAEAKRDNPDLARPCILGRSVVKKGAGFVVRVNYFVPNGELDPQGRSVKKKKKKKG